MIRARELSLDELELTVGGTFGSDAFNDDGGPYGGKADADDPEKGRSTSTSSSTNTTTTVANWFKFP